MATCLILTESCLKTQGWLYKPHDVTPNAIHSTGASTLGLYTGDFGFKSRLKVGYADFSSYLSLVPPTFSGQYFSLRRDHSLGASCTNYIVNK
jgi:hypothetical protein